MNGQNCSPRPASPRPALPNHQVSRLFSRKSSLKAAVPSRGYSSWHLRTYYNISTKSGETLTSYLTTPTLTHGSTMQTHMPTPVEDVSEILKTRYIGFVSFTILIWDHIVTFADEVEYVWKGSKGPLVYLFFLNRYLIPLGFIINLVAYSLQSWPVETCKHYVRYEGSMTVIGIEVVNIMMLLRVHALYHRKSQVVIGLVASILLVETGMNIYLLMNGIAVPHTSGVHSCSMIFDPSIGNAASASAWIPLLYDTVVFSLTLYRTAPSIQHREAGHVVRTIFKDGLLYYSVIFSVTLVLTIQITASPAGIKNITAQLELLLTVAMMSRITLNLKKEAHMSGSGGRHWDDTAVEITFSRDRSFTDATIRTRAQLYSSSDYLTGGADTGVNFTRPIPPRLLSTIRSERNLDSSAHTSENGTSLAAEGRDLGDMSWFFHTVVEEPEEHELRVRHEKDEESL